MATTPPPAEDSGERTFTFTASNTAGIATQVVTLSVAAAPPALTQVDIIAWTSEAGEDHSFRTTITTVPADAEVAIFVYGASSWNAQGDGWLFDPLDEGPDYTVDGKTVTILPDLQKSVQVYRLGATPK